jgi:hypothetical protein
MPQPTLPEVPGKRLAALAGSTPGRGDLLIATPLKSKIPRRIWPEVDGYRRNLTKSPDDESRDDDRQTMNRQKTPSPDD